MGFAQSAHYRAQHGNQEAAREMETHKHMNTEETQITNDQTRALIPTEVSPYSELNNVVRRNQPQSHSIYFFNFTHQLRKNEPPQKESILMICDRPTNM